MLYARWQKIVQMYRDEIALHDLKAGRRWTFGQLARESEQGTERNVSIAFPEGVSVDFVLAVLRGWRNNGVICPLESGQPALCFDSLPKACVHLKMTSATTGDA